MGEPRTPYEPGATGRLSWLEPVAAQVAEESGVPCGEQIEDLVVMAFEGLLNDPATGGTVSYPALLDRARHAATLWIRENDSAS